MQDLLAALTIGAIVAVVVVGIWWRARRRVPSAQLAPAELGAAIVWLRGLENDDLVTPDDARHARRTRQLLEQLASQTSAR